MKRILAFACVLAPSSAMAAPPLNAPADVAAIKALEQRNAVQLDAAALARTYAPDAVMIDYATGGIYRGRAAVQKSAAAALAPFKSVTADLQEQNILTDGQFACDLMTASFQFVTKDGKSGEIGLRQMDALEKIDGRWQVVQEQLSMPMDPKTGKAVMNGLAVRGDIVWPAAMANGQTVSPARAKHELAKWTNDSLRVIGIDAIMPYYGPGDDEVAIYTPTAPGNLRGKAEMRAYYTPSMNSFTGLHTTTPVLKIDSDGVLGAQIDVQDILLRLKDGKTRKLYWRQSDCLHRVGGKWYSVLEMSSFPVDMKTGQAVTVPPP